MCPFVPVIHHITPLPSTLNQWHEHPTGERKLAGHAFEHLHGGGGILVAFLGHDVTLNFFLLMRRLVFIIH